MEGDKNNSERLKVIVVLVDSFCTWLCYLLSVGVLHILPGQEKGGGVRICCMNNVRYVYCNYMLA